MKDNLFEILMNFFENCLSPARGKTSEPELMQPILFEHHDLHYFDNLESHSLIVKLAHESSMRIFTCDEQIKLTKASYQFIMRMLTWGVINSEIMEQVMNQLLFSESRFVTLEETKWTIRNALANYLDGSQLAFLDLVLYQKEDELPLH